MSRDAFRNRGRAIRSSTGATHSCFLRVLPAKTRGMERPCVSGRPGSPPAPSSRSSPTWPRLDPERPHATSSASIAPVTGTLVSRLTTSPASPRSRRGRWRDPLSLRGRRRPSSPCWRQSAAWRALCAAPATASQRGQLVLRHHAHHRLEFVGPRLSGEHPRQPVGRSRTSTFSRPISIRAATRAITQFFFEMTSTSASADRSRPRHHGSFGRARHPAGAELQQLGVFRRVAAAPACPVSRRSLRRPCRPMLRTPA